MSPAETPFADRSAAGRALGIRLRSLGAIAGAVPPAVVLGIPRGGVAVAAEVARELGVVLDILVAHKVGAPGEPELAVGAVAAGGTILIEPWGLDAGLIDEDTFARAAQDELERARARETRLRGERPPVAVEGRLVILVDDGMATGATMHVAVLAARAAGAARVIVAVPIASDEASATIGRVADDVVALLVPAALRSVGEWYARFPQLDDDEVVAILAAAADRDLSRAG